MQGAGALPLLFVALAVAGCLGPGGPEGGPEDAGGEAEPGFHLLREFYNGTVVSLNTPALLLSPDQAGDVERWFWVHDNTTEILLELDSSDDLTMYVLGPGCHGWDCAYEIATQENRAEWVKEGPQPGGWEVVFFKQDPGAAEIDYTLGLTKNQMELHKTEHEVHPGRVVAAHAVVFWISPDQLGDVFKEFWVPRGVTDLHIEVEADPDMRFVLGQSDPSRDSSSEEYHPTQGGRVDIHVEDPVTGGWYFIAFAPEEPGVHEIEYHVEIWKTRGQGAETADG